MKDFRANDWRLCLTGLLPALALTLAAGSGHAANSPATNEVRIVALEGTAEIIRSGATIGVKTSETNQPPLQPGDRLRTGPNSRVSLHWPGQSVVSFGPQTLVEILPPDRSNAEPGLHFLRGLLSFFHRGQPGRIRILAHGTTAGVLGTEFAMSAVETDGTAVTTISVVDGQVSLTRVEEPGVTLVLTNGQQAVAEPGKPFRTAGFIVNDVLQWCFYYPAVLDLDELPLSAQEQAVLADSLTAYRNGDLIAALAKYPAARQPASDAERLYHAALLLAVGQVVEAEPALAAVSAAEPNARLPRLANALRQLIAAVKRQPHPAATAPQLTTELLAGSYYEQSRTNGDITLRKALELARQATTNSPRFGFAWARVAELEFSFGRVPEARAAVEKALAFTPRNAEALALRGFLLAAGNKPREAVAQFDAALAVDPALGNARLGRGLCRIRLGDAAGGHDDLLVAAAVEPQRALLRSYLGKAFGDAGQTRLATHELDLSKRLDPGDPTPWLYSALLSEQNNRINDAISDLERSQELNNNRSVYRSGLLLDQDRAVRSANLARIYQEAGMEDVAFNEATRAVQNDYGNYSAHYFLANSYQARRDPNLVNLRFETAETSEYLVANLLSPGGAGVLSPTVSQQEYSRLFERNGLGLVSLTEYLSRGAWLERGAQYGTFGGSSYSLEGFYRHDPGERPNNDLEQMQLSVFFKQQFTPQDSAYVQASLFNGEAGDVSQRYNPQSASPTFRSREFQDGLVNLGYHHEWSPGSHTLILAGYLPDRFSFSDQAFPTLAVDQSVAYAYPDANNPFGMAQKYHAETQLFFVEAQQILKHNSEHFSVFGGRFQAGELKLESEQMNPINFQPFFPPQGTIVSDQSLSPEIQRWSLYAYHNWEVWDHLWLIGGLTYDHLLFPQNFLFPPLTDRTQVEDRLLPKAGFVWSPFKDTTLRFAYTRSMAGATLEQSYRLEPAQVAGFTQAYRGVIPETAVGGPVPGAPFDTYGVALEQKFPTRTYLTLSGEILDSQFTRTLGGYAVDPNLFNAVPTSVRQDLDYTEKSLTASLNQLVGRDWAFGINYRLTDSKLNTRLTEQVDPFLPLTNPGEEHQSLLHQLDFNARFNHPSGWFARFDAIWSHQDNRGFVNEPGQSFWQLNAWAGYRFAQRRVELAIGLLNMTDHDYHLEPLTPYNEMPHRRTLAVRMQLSF